MIMERTAIVTGASGNLGQAVVNKFITEGYEVIGTITSNNPGFLAYPSDKFEKVVVDLMNEDDWVKPETLADVIYMHCTESHAMLREPVIKVYGNS
jgi:nucleoside-diphosphate-sugar epimerase